MTDEKPKKPKKPMPEGFIDHRAIEAAAIEDGRKKYADDPIKAFAFNILCLANEHIGKGDRIENIRAAVKGVLGL